jgi:hypothetical protein
MLSTNACRRRLETANERVRRVPAVGQRWLASTGRQAGIGATLLTTGSVAREDADVIALPDLPAAPIHLSVDDVPTSVNSKIEL